MSQIFKLKNGTLFLSIEAPGGIYNSLQLKKIAELCNQDLAIVKATEDQRIGLFVKEAECESVAAELKGVGLGIRNYQEGLHQPVSCIGELCEEHEQDALGTAMDVTREIAEIDLAGPLKIGINGCARCCTPCHTLDISLVGERSGYRISLGGKGAQFPELAAFMAEGVPSEKVPDIIKNIIHLYQKNAVDDESLIDVIHRFGVGEFVKALAPYSQDAANVEDPLAEVHQHAIQDLTIDEDDDSARMMTEDPEEIHLNQDLVIDDEQAEDHFDSLGDAETSLMNSEAQSNDKQGVKSNLAPADQLSAEDIQDLADMAHDEEAFIDEFVEEGLEEIPIEMDDDVEQFGLEDELPGAKASDDDCEVEEFSDEVLNIEETSVFDQDDSADLEVSPELAFDVDEGESPSAKAVNAEEVSAFDQDDSVDLDDLSEIVDDLDEASVSVSQEGELSSDEEVLDEVDPVSPEDVDSEELSDFDLDDSVDLDGSPEIVDDLDATSASASQDKGLSSDEDELGEVDSLSEEDELDFERRLSESIEEERKLIASDEQDSNEGDRHATLSLLSDNKELPKTSKTNGLTEPNQQKANIQPNADTEAAESSVLDEELAFDVIDEEDLEPMNFDSSPEEASAHDAPIANEAIAMPSSQGSKQNPVTLSQYFKFSGMDLMAGDKMHLSFESGAFIDVDLASLAEGDEKTFTLGGQAFVLAKTREGFLIEVEGVRLFYPKNSFQAAS